MTQALCLACGAIKFGALCMCLECHAETDADERLAIDLSDHYYSVPALERLGRLLRDLGRVAPSVEVRDHAFRLFLREALKQRLANELPEELHDAARAALAAVEVPRVSVTGGSSAGGPMNSPVVRVAIARPDEIWALAREHVQRSAVLQIANEPPAPGEPYASLRDDGSIALHDPIVTVLAAADADVRDPSLQDAERIASFYRLRREALAKTFACVVHHQADFLRGASAAPAALTLDALAAELEMPPSAVRRRLQGQALRAFGRDHALDALVSMALPPRVPDKDLDRIGAIVAQLIEAEDPAHPHSDLTLTRLLREQGHEVARRTVAKCRERRGILSSARRRRG